MGKCAAFSSQLRHQGYVTRTGERPRKTDFKCSRHPKNRMAFDDKHNLIEDSISECLHDHDEDCSLIDPEKFSFGGRVPCGRPTTYGSDFCYNHLSYEDQWLSKRKKKQDDYEARVRQYLSVVGRHSSADQDVIDAST